MQRYNELSLAASQAASREEWSLAAENYREAVLAAPSPWIESRWKNFFLYTELISDPRSCGYEPTPDDTLAMKRLYKNQMEAVLFRANALIVLGFLKGRELQLEKAAHYFRMAVDLIPSSSELDRKVITANPLGDDELVPLGFLLGILDETINESIDALQTEIHVDISGIPKVNGTNDDDIMKRLVVGGGQCDCCGKERMQVDGNSLFRCTRCKRAYYCSSACQHRMWKSGHKEACRAPGQIEPGDYMLIKGLVNRKELNMKLVRAVKLVQPSGRWEVAVDGQSKTLSIAPEKLDHIRPYK